MGPAISSEDRLFHLKGYVSDAIDDVIQAAQACDNDAAKADLTEEVMQLFDAATELCWAMRRFAMAEQRALKPDAGIHAQPRLCSGDAPP